MGLTEHRSVYRVCARALGAYNFKHYEVKCNNKIISNVCKRLRGAGGEVLKVFTAWWK